MTNVRKVTIKHGKTTKRFDVHELDDWQSVADALAKIIKPGSIVSLSGPLGAGKTTLVQYLARTLGAPKRAISPTFALMRIYKLKSQTHSGICRLVHVDAYRLEDAKDLVVLDLDEELMEPGTVVLIEWPENIKRWLKNKKQTIKVVIKL
ncbi:MAG: tRNA (adenosine(37)-N6)-threonylcarbamoyltransferase complex ATPase subunit type 1 TsaE [Patescibacteria group bacterium]